MKLWSILFGDDEQTIDTVPGGSHTDNPTSTTQPKIVVERTEANGSTRTINTGGGSYNERIEGDYIQIKGQRINIDI